jgi:hypothetical protein
MQRLFVVLTGLGSILWLPLATVWFVWVFPNSWGQSLPKEIENANTWLVVLFFLSIVLTEIIFLVHCLSSKRLTLLAKSTWLFVLLFLPFLSLPAFWFLIFRNHSRVRVTSA